MNCFLTKDSNLTKKRNFFFEGGGGVDGWTDEQVQTNFPLQLQVGGITMHKCASYGPDMLNL